jgi:hypothetical protein
VKELRQTPVTLDTAGLERIVIELDPPVAGRGLLRVVRGTDRLEFPFSYAPRDSIELLAEAIDAVVSAPVERKVVFSSGPQELEVVFARAGERVDVRFVNYADHRRDVPGEEWRSFALSPRLVGRLFWRAFRQLQSRMDEGAYQEAWHHPFPTRLVAQLGSRLAQVDVTDDL